jgi:hypothetical protein
VKLVRVSADTDPVIFSLFLELPGANMHGWPGKKSMGMVLIGRLPLAPRVPGKGTWCVIAHQERFGIDHVKMPRLSDSDLEWMKTLAEKGELFGTGIGALDDGAMALFDLRSDGVELPCGARKRDAAFRPALLVCCVSMDHGRMLLLSILYQFVRCLLGLTVGCQKSLTCPDLGIHAKR